MIAPGVAVTVVMAAVVALVVGVTVSVVMTVLVTVIATTFVLLLESSSNASVCFCATLGDATSKVGLELRHLRQL